jgi:cellulose biosynthesis protein BcsQ
MAKLRKRVVVLDCDNQRNAFKFFSDIPETEFVDDQVPTRYENLDVAFLWNGEENYAPDGYDYVIMDLPPSLDERAVRIAESCDYVFIPIRLGQFSLQGMANTIETLAPTNAKIGGYFVCMYDKKNSSHIELDKMFRENMGGALVMKTRIPQSKSIENSVNFRRTAFEYMRTVPVREYLTLAKEIVRICEGK